MANPFLGEIKMFAGNFAPAGYALCNGQLLAISQNAALFSLIGTFYGGNGTSNFALPNFQGAVPLHWGDGPGLTPRVVGETGGENSVTLLSNEIPPHTHTYNCSSGSKGETNVVAGNVNTDEQTGSQAIYATAADATLMSPAMIQPTPSTIPHENQQPYLCVTFIIAMRGIFPARN